MTPDYSRRDAIRTILGSVAGISISACDANAGNQDAEVCIVGSGPAGAVLATALARKGITTILIDRGPAHILGSDAPRLTDFEFSRTFQYPVDSTRFLGPGGTSNLWGGESPRLQPLDFTSSNSYAPEAGWPISYEAIEPYYVAAERELSVHGGSMTPYSPPRSAGFPFLLDRSEDAPCLRALFGSAGTGVEATPQSRAPRMVESHLPRLETNRLCRIFRDTYVTNLEVDGRGEITALSARQAGTIRRFRARFYVLAAGGIETPRILLDSTSRAFPNGIGNSYSQVGRFFTEHLSVQLGVARLRPHATCETSGGDSGICWQHYHDFKKRGLGGVLFEMSVSTDGSVVRISGLLEMQPIADNRVVLGERGEDGSSASRVDVSLSALDRLTVELARETARSLAEQLPISRWEPSGIKFGWCHHHIGTCRMGNDPRKSVVDMNLRVHDLANLFVAGSAPFVTGGCGGPTLLLTALTLRLADHLEALVGRRQSALQRDSAPRR